MVGLNKYITIATDISCDDKNKISTWACYIRHDGGAIKLTGQFKEYQKNSHVAETYALINALKIAEANIASWNDSIIIIYNEIEYALSPLMTKGGKVKLHDSARADAILSVAMPILQSAKSWQLRDVKAHFNNWKKSNSPGRYVLNRWCDKESRNLLKKIRKLQETT